MHERDGQTDGQTDTGPQQRPRLRIASRGKKPEMGNPNPKNFGFQKFISSIILVVEFNDDIIFQIPPKRREMSPEKGAKADPSTRTALGS